jgi:beta-lactamase class A
MFLFLALSTNASAATSEIVMEQRFHELAAKSDGRVGICALDISKSKPACVNGSEKFPLQSVMKLIVGAVVMDAVDRKMMSLGDTVIVRPEDGSPGPQEFVKLAKAEGKFKTNIEDLVRRAIIDSDSTSVDMLVGRLGSISVVQNFLKRKEIHGISIDRDERHLQAESVGLDWKAEYADSDRFEAAVKALPAQIRGRASELYLKDLRDTSTPLAMVDFLTKLANGQLLSKESTEKLLAVMGETTTGGDRLKAGTPKNWQLGHKTGTGRSWKGITSATNDVGILRSPNGGKVAVAVFIAASAKSNDDRAAVIAKVAELVTSWYAEMK